MLHPVTFRRLALAACGGLFACNSFALTLGQPRGTALIGRPLDVSVPVTLDAPDPDGACSSAELYYGDTRVISTPEVRWLPGPSGREGTVRILSTVPVNEPTVTVNLRVGCGASSATRRYVLLPDVPQGPDAASTLPGTRVVPPAVATPVVPSPAPRAASSAPAPARPPAAAPARSRPQDAAPAAEPAARSTTPRPTRGDSRRQAASAPAAQAAAPAASSSRLRLAPLEIGPERDAILHFTTEMAPPGPGDAAKRAAAAALWQALNKTPEEAVQEGIRLQALDREIQSLRQLTQQNAAAVTTMRQQVEAARNDRNQVTTLALLLFALILAGAGWVGWRWYQSRRMADMTRWFDANRDDADDSVSQPVFAPASSPAPTGAPARGAKAAAASAALPSAARQDSAPVVATAVRAAIAGAAHDDSQAAEFQTSQGGTVRMVGVRELLDVHDKADFFLSIGQHEQAIAVLEAHVHDHVETSALPWLDLLELYHSLGRRQEFEERRAEFRQHFTAQVPDFDHFDEPTGTLENYSRALSRIVALWPSRRVLEVIEESMFRKPGLPGGDTFSLEAYRELVLLYHIAQEVAPQERSAFAEPPARPPVRDTFSATSVQPLSELDRPEIDLDVPLDLDDVAPSSQHEATMVLPEGALAWGDPHAAEREPLFIPPASPRLGLDIDLTDMGDEPAAPLAPSSRGGPSSLGGPAFPIEPSSMPEPTLVQPPPVPASPREGGPRELPPLDFDTSMFDGGNDDPPRR